MYVCMYVCVYTSMTTAPCLIQDPWISLHMYVCIVCMYVCVCPHQWQSYRRCGCIHLDLTHLYTYAHTHTHTHTYMYMPTSRLLCTCNNNICVLQGPHYGWFMLNNYSFTVLLHSPSFACTCHNNISVLQGPHHVCLACAWVHNLRVCMYVCTYVGLVCLWTTAKFACM